MGHKGKQSDVQPFVCDHSTHQHPSPAEAQFQFPFSTMVKAMLTTHLSLSVKTFHLLGNLQTV
jgi:hypothetical protein